MAAVRESLQHLVLASKMPSFTGDITFRQTYEQLRDTAGSAFLWTDLTGTRFLVKGQVLADKAFRSAGGTMDAVERLTGTPLREVIDQFRDDNIVLPVQITPLAAAAEAPKWVSDELVHEVRDGDKTHGWFLNHEGLQGLTTRRTIYICSNVPSHKSFDLDHGTCSFCPFGIVRTELE